MTADWLRAIWRGPRPALASLSFGRRGGVVFLFAMAAAMLAAKPVKARLARTLQP